MSSSESSGEPGDDLGAEQPLMSHLIELRDRLLRMVVAVLVAFLLLAPFANRIYLFLAEPIRAKLPAGSQMIATQVASPFLTPFKLALVVAIFVAMPYLLYQFWAFVAPGLYRHERRLALPLLSASILLFYLGMGFAYTAVFPLVFGFFTAVTPEGIAQMPDIAFYLEFVLKLLFAFGIAFQIPIATILLVAIGATTPEALVTKRPYVIVAVFVAGMFLTPPDVISQTLLAIPMWLLFELGIIFSRFFQRQLQGLAAASGAAPTPASAPVSPAPGDMIVGREIDGGDIDEPGRFVPLSDEEMETELDAIEAAEAEAAVATRGSADPTATSPEQSLPDAPPTARPDPGEELIRQANALRTTGNVAATRHLLYQILEIGNVDQRRVARNILADLDRD
ncbi:MAG: twin-arginine translocase subunit TatC [Chromatiaceae bacterium]|nr:MAG: twin-arginine translocase subunit TatC [Chromatiaceae bacterium]